MPVYLNLRNPISLAEYRSRYAELSGHGLNEGYSGDYISAVRDKYIAQLDKTIRKEGFDGITDPENGYYVAYEPNQIKSVNNRGSFDASANIYNQSAWHGSPHVFDKFDLGAIGTGEGAQVHGWGLYFAQDKKIAEGYRDRLLQSLQSIDEFEPENQIYSGKSLQAWLDEFERKKESLDPTSEDFITAQHTCDLLEDTLAGEYPTRVYAEARMIGGYNKQALKWFKKHIADQEVRPVGALFEVNVPEDDVLLDEDKPLSQQPLPVRKAIWEFYKSRPDEYIAPNTPNDLGDGDTGERFYRDIVFQMKREGFSESEAPRAASQLLNSLGIKGITYEGNRDGRCFVVFDDKAISVIERYNQEAARNTPQDYAQL